MKDQDFFLGLVKLHILHHAAHETVFGFGIIEELSRHGYHLSPGTIYPLLHSMERSGYLRSNPEERNGRVRKIYRATARGKRVLRKSREKITELFKELVH
ncbi:MAG: PadR family transcriptional regulator [Elusimicrobiota bacterium]